MPKKSNKPRNPILIKYGVAITSVCPNFGWSNLDDQFSVYFSPLYVRDVRLDYQSNTAINQESSKSHM